MKKSLEPGQVRILIGVLVLLLTGGGAAWFGLDALSGKQDEAQALLDKMASPDLAALLADPAGTAKVTREITEIEKLGQELLEKDGVALKQWKEATGEAYGRGKGWAADPGQWKDELIRIQSELQKKAPESRLKLPPDFYLGLEAFRQKSPADEKEVSELAMHLSVAGRLVERLMEARKVREQFPSECELKKLTGPGTVLETAAPAIPGPGAPRPPESKGPQRKTFRLELESSPEVLYEYVRLLSGDSWLFIVKDMVVTNEQQDFPSRSEIAKKFSPGEGQEASGTTGVAPSEKRLLEVLAGKERLRVALELDFVAWNETPAGPVNPPAGKAP